MNLLWLGPAVALLAVNVIAQDKTTQNEERFPNVVRKKSCQGSRFCYDTNENVDRETRPKISNTQSALNQPIASLATKLEQTNNKTYSKREDMGFRRCRTLRCRLRLGSDKENNQEETETKAHQDEVDSAEKRCMSWKCKKRRFRITREKSASRKSKFRATDEKRCMAWGCRKRSQRAFTRDISMKLKNGAMKQENLKEQEQNVEKTKQCATLRCKKEVKKQDKHTTNAKGSECLAWSCHGKRTAANRGPGAIDTSKRIINRKQRFNDLLALSRNGKCRGLECLTKRRRNLNPLNAATFQNGKNEPTASDISKRIIKRKKYEGQDFLGLSGEKCRGWACLKRRLANGVQSDKPKMCLSWDCDKRKADTDTNTKTASEYRDMIRRKRSPRYFTKEDFQEERMSE